MKRMRWAGVLAIGVVVLAGCRSSLTVPEGWIVAGSHPKDYVMGVVPGAEPEGASVVTIESVAWWAKGFGTLMQQFAPGDFLGKRVRFSARVRSEDVSGWAGLWMRVDGPAQGSPLAFDNMSTRPIKGTTGWAQYEVVLDVPSEATNIALGILLGGKGQVWMTDVDVRVVSTEVEVTERPRPLGPQNLALEPSKTH